MTRRVLRWWHVAFGIVGLAFAGSYFRLGFSEGGGTADMVKGGLWVALAIFMILPELIGKGRRRDEESHPPG